MKQQTENIIMDETQVFEHVCSPRIFADLGALTWSILQKDSEVPI